MTDKDKAIRAMYAWFYCEDNGLGSHAARQELCSYTEYLCQRVVDGSPEQYRGVPRMYLHGIERCNQEEAEKLVSEVFETIANKEPPDPIGFEGGFAENH